MPSAAASDPLLAAALAGLGVDELPMAPVAIPEVRDVLSRLELGRCEDAVRHALESGTDGGEVRRLLDERLDLDGARGNSSVGRASGLP